MLFATAAAAWVGLRVGEGPAAACGRACDAGRVAGRGIMPAAGGVAAAGSAPGAGTVLGAGASNGCDSGSGGCAARRAATLFTNAGAWPAVVAAASALGALGASVITTAPAGP